MRSVGLKVLKNRFSEYVRLAAGGETVLLTDRDRVVAEIVPPQAGRSPLLADALLAEAVRNGWLMPPTLPGGAPPPRKPVATARKPMQELQRDLRNRRSISTRLWRWRTCWPRVACRQTPYGRRRSSPAASSNTRCGTVSTREAWAARMARRRGPEVVAEVPSGWPEPRRR